jgi:hypothetical protein
MVASALHVLRDRAVLLIDRKGRQINNFVFEVIPSLMWSPPSFDGGSICGLLILLQDATACERLIYCSEFKPFTAAERTAVGPTLSIFLRGRLYGTNRMHRLEP